MAAPAVTASPTATVREGPAGTVSVAVLPSGAVISTREEPLSPALMAETLPVTGALNTPLLLFSPVGYTWPRPRLPPTWIWYLPKWMLLSVAGSGERIGKTISWCWSPEIGPTSRMLGWSSEYWV